MIGGTHGKILHVNLTTGKTKIEHPPDDFYRLLVGGRAVVAYLLLPRPALQHRPPQPRQHAHLCPRHYAGHKLSRRRTTRRGRQVAADREPLPVQRPEAGGVMNSKRQASMP